MVALWASSAAQYARKMPRKAASKALNVAVTGAAGYVAGRLIEQLAADDRVARVVGFDVRPPAFTHPKFVFDEVDVRNPALEARFKDVDVVVHLAFIMDPIHDENEMRDVNVNGSQNVFTCAGKAGVKKIVYTSSAVAYGAHPDNDFPLTEDSPLRANLDFSYPAHKLEVEYVVREFRQEFPNVTFTLFRPCIVFGPHVDNAWSHQLQAPVMFSIQGYEAPLQFVHEDDVARALLAAVFADWDGAYNLAPEGYLTAEQMLEVLGRKRYELPEPIAFGLAKRMWSIGAAEAPEGMLHYVMHPWVVSTEKLAAEGFKCEISNLEAFTEVVERNRGLVRVGRRSLKRGDIAKGAAIVGVLSAAAAIRSVRKRTKI
jgi:UDP-glucose 4-epimerase